MLTFHGTFAIVFLCYFYVILKKKKKQEMGGENISIIKIYIQQWRLETFQPEDAVQKTTLHRLKFFFANFIELISLFFKFNIKLKKKIFWVLRPKWILVCVSEGRNSKLILVTLQSLRWKSIIFHNESAYPMRKS